MTLELGELETPIGTVRAVVGPAGLCAVSMGEQWPRTLARLRRRFGDVPLEPRADPGGVIGRLRAYFAGKLDALDDLETDPGGTAFQRRVWQALRRIPVGTTCSYGELAERVGIRFARPVGTANGANPVGIVVPCHRVIAADGTLCGYGGGLERKRWLLHHEGVRGVWSTASLLGATAPTH